MALPLNAIQAFAAAARHHGVRAAARELGVSHSSISRYIVDLERWLGFALLDRRSRAGSFVMTEQGRRLASAASDALQDLESAIDAGKESRSAFTVTVSTVPSLASRWLLHRLLQLRKQHPRLEISIVVEQRVEDSRALSSDLAIRMGRGPWPGLDCMPFMDDALYPVASPRCLEANGVSADDADLRRLKLIHDRDPAASWSEWRRAHGPADLDVRAGQRFSSSDLVLRAAAQGDGVALARHQMLGDDLATGALVRLLPDKLVRVSDAYWILTRPGLRQKHAVKILTAWLRHEGRRASASIA